MEYTEAEAYINNIPRFSKIKSEKNVSEILACFGHPEESFSYIHVAGTNGKGSVCAYLDGMLRAAGKRTGLFTSPHLIRMTERMKVDGIDISEKEFCEIFDELTAVVKKREMDGCPHPTFFEWLYLMAMIWFGRMKIAFGVIETGLGGRLDATNVIRHPVITVITSISYDHTDILGDTLDDISREKAGIIKEGVPVICDGSEPCALKVFAEKAEKLNCPLTVISPGQIGEPVFCGKNIEFTAGDIYGSDYRIRLGTPALYQMMNAGLALAAVKCLQKTYQKCGIDVDDGVLLDGLASVRWPGRMDEAVPGVLVDGAHNAGGARGLRESLEAVYGDRGIWLLFAVANDKDCGRMAEILCGIPQLKGVVVTEIGGDRKTSAAGVADVFKRKQKGSVVMVENTAHALETARKCAGDDGLVVCTGSLYLAGSVLEILNSGPLG